MSGQAQMSLARAWAVQRKDGLRLGFTDHDAVLRFDGLTFRPDTGMGAKAVVQGLGLSVDNTEAVGALSHEAITEADIAAGRWDGAEVRLWEVDWADTAKRREIFRGHLGEVGRTGGAFRAELRGLAEPLAQVQGRVYHPRCAAQLGDAACGVNLSAPGYFANAGLVRAAGAVLRFDGLGDFADRWFEHGLARIETGAATGLAVAIKGDRLLAGGAREVTLWSVPWEAAAIAPAPGDRVRLIAGCDKRAATCQFKFANFLNFRGFPHLPQEDWLMAPQVARVAGRTLTFENPLAGGLAHG